VRVSVQYVASVVGFTIDLGRAYSLCGSKRVVEVCYISVDKLLNSLLVVRAYRAC
jgi:hypothetical protein